MSPAAAKAKVIATELPNPKPEPESNSGILVERFPIRRRNIHTTYSICPKCGKEGTQWYSQKDGHVDMSFQHPLYRIRKTDLATGKIIYNHTVRRTHHIGLIRSFDMSLVQDKTEILEARKAAKTAELIKSGKLEPEPEPIIPANEPVIYKHPELLVVCSKCGDKGIVGSYIHPDRGGVRRYYIRHGAIDGLWGKARKQKRRKRCYFKQGTAPEGYTVDVAVDNKKIEAQVPKSNDESEITIRNTK